MDILASLAFTGMCLVFAILGLIQIADLLERRAVRKGKEASVSELKGKTELVEPRLSASEAAWSPWRGTKVVYLPSRKRDGAA